MRSCIKCGESNRNSRGDCRTCINSNGKAARIRRTESPCSKCGASDWTAAGNCRSCKRLCKPKDVNEPCGRCGAVDWSPQGICRSCSRARTKSSRIRRVGNPCTKCGGLDWTAGGTCRSCNKLRESKTNKPCKVCMVTDRNSRGDCRSCNRTRTKLACKKRAELQGQCSNCGSSDWTAGGACRSCIRKWNLNHVGKPCGLCGTPRTVSGCLPCRRRCERLRNGMLHASDASGVGEICEICRVTLTTKGPHGYTLDHDHRSGIVRGWLCVKCNAGLGNFGDNPEYLRAAATYLEKHRRGDDAS